MQRLTNLLEYFHGHHICYCTVSVLCQCYSCVATILSDVNCTHTWVQRSDTYASSDKRRRDKSTLAECKKACEFDPHCVSVDWRSSDHSCDLSTEPNHDHYNSDSGINHYELVSRCNITSGQCLDSIVVSNINVATENYSVSPKNLP